jgi:uncharacterized coiled-coil DUF342 family protein
MPEVSPHPFIIDSVVAYMRNTYPDKWEWFVSTHNECDRVYNKWKEANDKWYKAYAEREKTHGEQKKANDRREKAYTKWEEVHKEWDKVRGQLRKAHEEWAKLSPVPRVTYKMAMEHYIAQP